ncbi:response regulator transcription factor [Streptomyces sp. PTM05]|uniref:Response regulator transcription factor n=2 Tax=Streptantibioticus parmotrematis TaxID=2873249 RepID=A0ABS7QWC3_9ACTN|nr:response regulator transcription factor [Streptantibioticus parmotrematis]
MPPMSQLAIIEQQILVRRGLESLLSNHPQVELAAVAADSAGLRASNPRGYDVIVYGVPQAERRPFSETVGALAGIGRVLILAEFTQLQPVTDALRAGAFGCVGKQATEEELLRAVSAVAQGGVYVSPGLADRMLSELRQPVAGAASPALAQREMEALRWLATGLTHGQIARRMGLTETTVSTYVKRIRSKLNVGNKADLTRKAIQLGLLSAEFQSSVDATVPGFPPAA